MCVRISINKIVDKQSVLRVTMHLQDIYILFILLHGIKIPSRDEVPDRL